MQKIKSEQLVTGVIKYLNVEIIPCIEDKFTKLLLRTMTISAEANLDSYTKLVDEFVRKPFISDLLKTEKDVFEIESLIDAVRQAVNECGELVIKIPPVKFISPEEKTLSFNNADISKLKQYLTDAIK